MHLILCNGNLTGENSLKLNSVMIRHDNLTPFPSKQLLGFLPLIFQSTFLLLYMMIQWPYVVFFCPSPKV